MVEEVAAEVCELLHAATAMTAAAAMAAGRTARLMVDMVLVVALTVIRAFLVMWWWVGGRAVNGGALPRRPVLRLVRALTTTGIGSVHD